jgi:hypothetical protein
MRFLPYRIHQACPAAGGRHRSRRFSTSVTSTGQIVGCADPIDLSRLLSTSDPCFGKTVWQHLSITLTEGILAFLVGAVAGVALGFWLARKCVGLQIADKVPQEYWLGDKELYIAAVKNNLQVYSHDGIIITESRQRSLDFLKQFDKEMAAATVDPAKTWDGRFVAKAADTIK